MEEKIENSFEWKELLMNIYSTVRIMSVTHQIIGLLIAMVLALGFAGLLFGGTLKVVIGGVLAVVGVFCFVIILSTVREEAKFFGLLARKEAENHENKNKC